MELHLMTLGGLMSERNIILVATKIFTGILVLSTCLQAHSSEMGVLSSQYNKAVLADNPVMFLSMGSARRGIENDLSGHNNNGIYFPSIPHPRSVNMPNGEL